MGTKIDMSNLGRTAVFKPLSLGGMELPNRIVMAPMTRRRAVDGVLTQLSIDYYARRAAAGVPLIISEATYIDHPYAGVDRRVPVFFGDAALESWRNLVDAVHAEGSFIFPQLWHVGAQLYTRPELERTIVPMTPSGFALNGTEIGEPMTVRDIDSVIASYARGASTAVELGFDGVEIHGAHGYLIDEFLWHFTNRRTDRYNGSLMARARFASEVVAAMRAAAGPSFPISFRLSQWKTDHYDARLVESPGELGDLLGPIVEAGVTCFHTSTRRFWQTEFPESDLTLAGWVRHLTGVPTIAVGSAGIEKQFIPNSSDVELAYDGPLDELFLRMKRDEFDLIAVGRGLLADPEWALAIRDGRPIKPFVNHSPQDLY
ncbi:MAG TPA: 12-oxophytodienoate reductase [Terrimesophilobacter sp.]|nr:12-oxophytodienoate reductase [Terrimesophilobacter sp.]